MGRPAKEPGTRVRDQHPTGIRIPPELKAAITREAEICGRTFTAEVLLRLQRSLEACSTSGATLLPPPMGGRGSVAEPDLLREEFPGGRYVPAPSPLSDAERLLHRLVGELTVSQQLALITLLQRR